jgi:hypothetical protein
MMPEDSAIRHKPSRLPFSNSLSVIFGATCDSEANCEKAIRNIKIVQLP